MDDIGRPVDSLASRSPYLRSKTFETHIAAYQPPNLFHYTNQLGLIGIFTSGELWASKIQYMNDSTEFYTALELVNAYVAFQLPKMADGPLKKKWESLLNLDYDISHANIFVACFCENGDLLSQWRGYANSSGYAIGFKSDHLARSGTKFDFQLARCVYNIDDQKKIIAELVDACIADPKAEAKDLQSSICALGVFFKSETFSEEKEWRLVSPITFATDNNVNFRSGRSMLTPYYRLPLSIQERGAIPEVVVGPCPHPELSLRAVEMLAWKAGIVNEGGRRGGIRVSNSRVPYRNW